MERLRDWNRALEVGHRSEGRVGAVEEHFSWRRLQPRPLQDIRQPDAAPPPVADGAMPPLQTRHRRLIEAASVSRALEHADQLHRRHPSKVVHRQRQRVRDLAIDRQPPLADVDARRVDMGTDEEVIDRRDVVREALDRHLEIQRTSRPHDHVALATGGPGLKQGGSGEEKEMPAGEVHLGCFSAGCSHPAPVQSRQHLHRSSPQGGCGSCAVCDQHSQRRGQMDHS